MSDNAPESGRTMEWNPASACRYCGLRFGDPLSDCMGPHRRESDDHQPDCHINGCTTDCPPYVEPTPENTEPEATGRDATELCRHCGEPIERPHISMTGDKYGDWVHVGRGQLCAYGPLVNVYARVATPESAEERDG